MIIHNANVHTIDATNNRAQAVAVEGDRITAVGTNDEILTQAGVNGPKIDAAGKTLLPGLIDSHIHVASVGENLEKVRTNDLVTLEQLLERVGEAAADLPEGQWIQGASDWHESQLTENRFPSRWELDSASPKHPVFLRRGGHNVVVNTLALKMAGIGEEDADPAGGRYDRNDAGSLTGWILERPAIQQVERLLPERTPEQSQSGIRHAMNAFASTGITAVRAMHVGPQELAGWRALAETGSSPVRGVLMISIHPRRPAGEDFAMLEELGLAQDQGDDRVRIGGLKMTHDGGVETSPLSEDYANQPGFRGIEVAPVAKIRDVSEFACRNGWRMAVHTVGDQAIRNVLNIWTELDQSYPVAGAGWALEHPYLLTEAEIDQMKRLGVVPHMQTSHNYTLGVGWREFWGAARANRSIPNRTLIDAGFTPAGGTDSPVTPFDPFLAMWADVTRQTAAAGVLGAHEAVTPLEALKMHTIWAAHGLGMEDRIGFIEPGKLADLVLVSEDPLAVDPNRLRELRAEMTISGGKIVHGHA